MVRLGRAGQDLSKYRLNHSHLGFAYKTDQGPWRVVHRLNTCGSHVSHIYRQGLGEYFMDDLWRHEGIWSPPAPSMQGPLLALRTDDRRNQRLHEPAHNLVSYAWGTRYPQSNQWVIETLAMAAEPGVSSRTQAQAWLQFKGCQPSTLHLGGLTRLGASTTTENIRFDDHPNSKRYSGQIETVTVDSVLEWMQRSVRGSAPARITLGATARVRVCPAC